ncbi:MAG: 6-pyruvoyl tetrahydropterin synthase family protein [Planctomycetales bacterium]
MVAERFRVRVTKDNLVFSAAHFITFAGGECERLHGHNWRTAVEVEGELDRNHYVFDFVALRDALAAIVRDLDHRMLLPTLHPRIRVTERESEVEAVFQDRRWIFPREDCVLLPIENTTAELLARWIGHQLSEAIHAQAEHPLRTLRVEVEENFGQWATCELPLEHWSDA